MATLEVSVHLDLNEDLPTDRYYIKIEIPNDLLILEVNIKDLPDDWDASPPTLTTQSIGDDFVDQNKSAILKYQAVLWPENSII